jgi:hypothetical protein
MKETSNISFYNPALKSQTPQIGLMRHLNPNFIIKRNKSRITTPLSIQGDENENLPHQTKNNDHLSLILKSGKLEHPVAFAQNLKRDLNSTKFNNTPES